MPPLDVVTVADAARRLGITEASVRVYIREGRLPSVKVGRRRFLLASLEDALAEDRTLDRVATSAVAHAKREPRR